MRIDVLPSAEEVAVGAARWLAARARASVRDRGRFSLAVSGGRTPWRMLHLLASEEVPWGNVHLFQVDERVAPDGDPDRNWTHIQRALLDHVKIPPANLHPMPVEAGDLAAAALSYAGELASVAGAPPVLDAVHLGLGTDGHTASLVPGDPVLDVAHADVALAGAYGGRVRMTLTFPALDRARDVLWVVTGADKASALARLEAGDRSIPAGRIRSDGAVVLADAPAAVGLASGR
jgi:6-phosphogluconolactonase